MHDPVTPWSEYARDEWARIGARWANDPVRPPETDEEPATCPTCPCPPHPGDCCTAASRGSAAGWAMVALLVALVLVAIAWRLAR